MSSYVPKITLMRGLPASGKSTKARELKTPNTVIVSRDDIREKMFLGEGVLSQREEDTLTQMEDAMVRAALRAKHDVIIDSMHLKQSYINRWQKLGYPVEIVECNAPLDELLFRNIKRSRFVPEDVIRKLHKKFTNKDGSLRKVILKPEEYVTMNFPKYLSELYSNTAYIFDIDGTLAHNDGHRSFYDYSRVRDDSINGEVAFVAEALSADHDILIVSGRKNEARKDTLLWLEDHAIPYTSLYMREDGDDRSDAIVKYEILMNEIAPNYEVFGVFDDRPSVCEMWRNVGIPTFQVGDPDNRF